MDRCRGRSIAKGRGSLIEKRVRSRKRIRPESVLIAESDEVHAAVMLEPGAWRSTQVPWLEKDDLASDDVVDPTVIASAAEEGELRHASALLLPRAEGVHNIEVGVRNQGQAVG